MTCVCVCVCVTAAPEDLLYSTLKLPDKRAVSSAGCHRGRPAAVAVIMSPHYLSCVVHLLCNITGQLHL